MSENSRPTARQQSLALWKIGMRCIEEQQFLEAVQALRQSTLTDPTFSPALNDLGVLMEILGRPGQAMECYEAALRADPTQVETRENLRQLCLQRSLIQALRGRFNVLAHAC